MERIFLILSTLWSFFLSLIPTTYAVDFHMISNITNVQQVLFKNRNEIVLVKDGDIFLYNVESRELSEVGERDPNDFVGLTSNGEILLCSMEHFLIDSYDDFSTKFTIRNLGEDQGKEMKFFETIRPIYLDEEKIIAVTAIDFLEQHRYLIDLEDGSMEELVVEKKSFGVKVPESIEVKDVHYYNKEMYVLEDVFGNMYLYRETRGKFLKE
jgi:hypothetical protein